MLCIIQYQTRKPLSAEELMQAVEIAQEVRQAVENLEGVRSTKLYMGRGTFAFVSDAEGYFVVDKALTSPQVQATLGKLAVEFGYYEASQDFFYDLEQIFPFIEK